MRQQTLGSAVLSYFKTIFPFLAIGLFAMGFITDQNNLLLLSVFAVYLNNMVYSIAKLRERFVFFLFNLSCLFFLFGRNLIMLFTGENWQSQFSHEVNKTAVSLIFVSLFFLYVGCVIASQIDIKDRLFRSHQHKDAEQFKKSVQIVSLVLFLFCSVFLILGEFDKLIFMQGKEYYQYYAEYQPSIPSAFLSIGALTKFCLCVFLATKPTKRMALIPFGIYTFSTVPMFIIGQRNSLISAVLFLICYYVIRDYCDKSENKRWFGKIEISILVVALPFVLAFLSMYESIRYGNAANTSGILDSIGKLLRSQGVTYDVISKGLESANTISNNSHFTFGPLIVYILGNTISMRLFGTSTITPQTVESAFSGYNFGDAVSYKYLGESFVSGAGLGSSYIIETFLDFGLIGLVLFSIILGFILCMMVKAFGKSMTGSFIILVYLLGLFMLPRARALDTVVLLIYIPMFFIVSIIAFLSALLIKKYHSNLKKVR